MLKRLAFATGLTMFTSASIHMFILFVQSIIQADYEIMNIFTIIGLGEIWPALEKGLAMAILSWVATALLIGLFYFLISKKFAANNPSKSENQ
ncbi:hypothetical protein FWG95_00250 [Candidatus Saccharibacteria bacterium]|nr:hypothetical protein [Candidatus Saccharibacteria bacterium]